MNFPLLKTAARVWLIEIMVSSFNYFILMNLMYESRWGFLVAHQIGMTTRALIKNEYLFKSILRIKSK
jgi:hypothetical protein